MFTFVLSLMKCTVWTAIPRNRLVWRVCWAEVKATSFNVFNDAPNENNEICMGGWLAPLFGPHKSNQ